MKASYPILNIVGMNIVSREVNEYILVAFQQQETSSVARVVPRVGPRGVLRVLKSELHTSESGSDVLIWSTSNQSWLI